MEYKIYQNIDFLINILISYYTMIYIHIYIIKSHYRKMYNKGDNK